MPVASQISFFVAGLPQTQAGMREVPILNKAKQVIGKRLITTGSDDLKPWRNKVTQTAQYARNLHHWATLTEMPVQMACRFFLPMAVSRPAAVRARGIEYSFRKPDLDKMVRAIGDSLTEAAIYKDDGQVARTVTEKFTVHNRALCGVEVVVQSIDMDDEVLQARLASTLLRRESALRQR